MSQFGVQLHARSARNLSGNGKLRIKNRDRKRHEVGGYFTATKLGNENVVTTERGRGATQKIKLRNAAYANLLTKDGYKKVKIKSIVESRDNRNFARLTILTKGAIIETELGKAVITNRVGREGSVNAKLLQ